MSTELVKVSPQELQTGGAGVDFSSKLFRLKPATLTINQGMTQAEGAQIGKFRVVETDEQFNEMSVVLLQMPREQRQYYIGESGKLNRSPENMVCFSLDMIKPHENSKIMQAPNCSVCPRSSWDKWQETHDPKDVPSCDAFYYAVFIDTVTQVPLKMYVRGANKKPFEAGMQNLARTFKLLQAKGENPNIFDIAFTMTTEKHTNKNKQISYVLKVDGKSFHKVKPDEASKFGELYLNYINRGQEAEPEPSETISEEVNTAIEGEIVI